MTCHYYNGQESPVCAEYGGFYAAPREGEKPTHREGWIWRDCTEGRKWCEPQMELNYGTKEISVSVTT